MSPSNPREIDRHLATLSQVTVANAAPATVLNFIETDAATPLPAADSLGLLGAGASTCANSDRPPPQYDPDIANFVPSRYTNRCWNADAPVVGVGSNGSTATDDPNDPLVTIYRGVGVENAGYSDATKGACQAQNPDAQLEPWGHVRNMANSQYTSWTLSHETAVMYATQQRKGVVMKICTPASNLTRFRKYSPSGESSSLQQVLVQSSVEGAAIVGVER